MLKAAPTASQISSGFVPVSMHSMGTPNIHLDDSISNESSTPMIQRPVSNQFVKKYITNC